MIGVSILGATGSIGTSTLQVLALHQERYQVVALSANRDVEAMLSLCKEWQPAYAVMADEVAAEQLRKLLSDTDIKIKVLGGIKGLDIIAALPEVDYVMAAIVGAAGLQSARAAAKAGKRILLANKEALVMSGQLFMDEVRDNGAQLLPIDSEHNAIFQCLPQDYEKGLSKVGVRRVLLTASGGPFRTMPLNELEAVSPEQACAHPNWSMGRKISVDSATMINKGLELIEACWLFNTRPENVEVVLHPQSIIHSMVDYDDGSVLAQLGCADMRVPIAHAMAWPERMTSGAAALDLFDIARLDFEKPDLDRFPCLRLAYRAAETGGTAATVLNAANEVAVEAFLAKRIRFTAIAEVIEKTQNEIPQQPADSMEIIMSVDAASRQVATRYVDDLSNDLINGKSNNMSGGLDS